MLGDISSIDAGALVTGMGGGLALFLIVSRLRWLVHSSLR
jgi:hypothetical protein